MVFNIKRDVKAIKESIVVNNEVKIENIDKNT